MSSVHMRQGMKRGTPRAFVVKHRKDFHTILQNLNSVGPFSIRREAKSWFFLSPQFVRQLSAVGALIFRLLDEVVIVPAIKETLEKKVRAEGKHVSNVVAEALLK